jgi:hypothetical protein
VTTEPEPVRILAISGAAGVGKSTTALEASELLRRAGVAHALIDTDELDRISPVPSDLAAITERNLVAVWESFRERGVRRLILVGVFLDQPSELAWIRRAVPDAAMTLVRLTADPETILGRVRRREIGTGGEDQAARTRRQLEVLAHGARDGVSVLETDGRPVTDVARDALALAGWAVAAGARVPEPAA